MKKSMFVVSCFAVTLAVAPACATKKFVRTEVGQVNDVERRHNRRIRIVRRIVAERIIRLPRLRPDQRRGGSELSN